MRNLRQYAVNASASDDDGVIGYHAATVAPPYTLPSAAALLPSMKMRSPTRSLLRTRIGSGHSKLFSACSRPIRNALRFDSSSASLPLYCSPKSFSTTSASMSSSADSAPR